MVNRAADAADLARLRTVAIPGAGAAATATVRITGRGTGARTRLFTRRGTAWKVVTGTTVLTAAPGPRRGGAASYRPLDFRVGAWIRFQSSSWIRFHSLSAGVKTSERQGRSGPDGGLLDDERKPMTLGRDRLARTRWPEDRWRVLTGAGAVAAFLAAVALAVHRFRQRT